MERALWILGFITAVSGCGILRITRVIGRVSEFSFNQSAHLEMNDCDGGPRDISFSSSQGGGREREGGRERVRRWGGVTEQVWAWQGRSGLG